MTDLQQTVPVVYRGLLPDLFREGQGVIAEGTLGADGVFTAREVLAKHDENYMPPEVAKALKEVGTLARKGAGRNDALPMSIARARERLCAPHSPRCARVALGDGRSDPELGHFALILALAVALVQGTLPFVGAARGDIRLMALGRHGGADAGVPGDRCAFGCADAGLRHVGLLGRQRRRQLALGQAADLQDLPACGGTTRARCCCGR